MLKTKLFPLADCGLDSFTFAGFPFPRYLATLERGNLKDRLADRQKLCCGNYYHAPKPLTGSHPGVGFYLGSDGQPFERWEYCDEVDGTPVKHRGWYYNESGNTIRGIVAKLPHGRYLAGHTMGKGMSSAVDGTIYDNIVDAARAADSMAEIAADRQREYEEAEQARMDEESRDDRLSVAEEEYRHA